MLTNEVKRNIDNARNVLVGKIPNPQSQIDQITTALIYKFMFDMDLESIEQGGKASFLTGELKKYSWDKYFDDSLSADEKFNLYDDALRTFATAKQLPELFRQIFKDSFLPYRDSRVLRLFLKEINKFEYDHSESLGNGFEYLLSILGSQGEAGQFRTPRNIIDFMVEVIDPKKNETILDPACGTAGFLISSFKHIKKHNSSNFDPQKDLPTFMRKNKKDVHEIEIQENGRYKGDKLTSSEIKKLHENIYGYDISEDMVRLSKVNMYLHHIRQQNISVYDTLSNITKWDDYFDVILANPPFMTPKGGIEPHTKFGVQANRSEVLFVDYISEHIKTNGRGACIVPEGVIFQSGKAYKQLRKNLIDGNVLYAVVSLPSGVFQPYSGVKTSILFFNKKLAKTKDEILFVKVENDGFDLGAKRTAINRNDLGEAYCVLKEFENKSISKLSEIYKHVNIKKLDKISYKVEKPKIAEDGDYLLKGDRYKSFEAIQNTNWPIVKIGEVMDVNASQINPSKVFGNKKFIYIDITSVENGTGIVSFNNYIIGKNAPSRARRKVQQHDILLSTVRPNLKAFGYLDNIPDNAVASTGFAVLTPRNGIISKYVYYLLFSDNVQNQMISRMGKGAYPSINQTDVKQLKIPLPPLEVQEQIVSEIQNYQNIIDGAMQIINSWKPQIQINPDWPYFSIGETCDLMTGGTPKSTVKDYYENGNIKWLVSGDIHLGEIYDCPNRITQTGMNNSNTKILPLNSVLIALNGQGKTRGTVAMLRTEATCNQSIVSINPKNKKQLVPEYLYIVLQGMYQEIRNITGDTQRSGLSMRIIKDIKIPIPPLEIQKNIVSQIEAEKTIVEANKNLAVIYQGKIKAKITELWGE